ncbi:hypothetical protein [Ensifer aridi]|uniref:hypothetical protein n=1 Tax=Ensifer aridi TaxID=1708715 RepID=UPI0004223D5D|nr:hypothetical protein [Ensifer aridi]
MAHVEGRQAKATAALRASRELTVYIALAGLSGNSVTAAITETVIRVLATATAVAVTIAVAVAIAVAVTIAVAAAVTIVAAAVAVTGVVTRLRNVDNKGHGVRRQKRNCC